MEHVVGAFHVGLDERLAFAPAFEQCPAVDHVVDAFGGFCNRSQIAEIACINLDLPPGGYQLRLLLFLRRERFCERLQFLRIAAERHDIITMLCKLSDSVSA